MLSKISLILVVLSLSCVHHVRPPAPAKDVAQLRLRFHGDVDFGRGEREAIEQAGRNIAHDTAGIYQVSFVWDLDFKDMVSVDRAHRDGWALIRKEGDPDKDPPMGKLVGLTSVPARVMVLMYDRLETEKEWLHTTEHELLHAAGLGHVCTIDMLGFPGCATFETDDDAMTALMFPMYDKTAPVCMNRGDRDEFCRVFNCDPKTLGGCP